MMSEQLELLTDNPSQWTAVCYVTPEIQKKEIKPYVALALKELEGTPDGRISSLMNADKFAAVRAVVRHVARLRSATKEAWNQDDLKTFLESLKFSPECLTELTYLLTMDTIYTNLPKHLRVKPGVVSLQWRIDISLSQSKIQAENPTPQRRKEIIASHTYVILILELTNAETHTHRLSVGKFHELRYIVASALKNMIVLERRKCMKRE